MIHTSHTRSHKTAPTRTTPRRVLNGPARRRHEPDLSDAVVAAYIHDISARSEPPSAVSARALGLTPSPRR